MKRIFRFSSGRTGASRDVHDELRFHIENRTQELIKQGMDPEEARRTAEKSFGDYTAIEGELRTDRIAYVERNERYDRWGSLRMDVAYALRSLRKNLGFTAAAVTTLALGIGATVAVYTVVNGVLVRPLPYTDPSRLGMIWLRDTESDDLGARQPLSAGFAAMLQSDSSSFERVAAFRSWPYTVAGDGAAEQVAGARVSPALFETLGVAPILGRTFADDGDPRVVVLSYGYWQRRFGGARDVVGQRLLLSGEAFTVAAVMPKDFAFPRGAELPAGLRFGGRTDLWTPLIFSESDRRNFGTQNTSAVGRLRRGLTHEEAEKRLSGDLQTWLSQNNSRWTLAYSVVTLKDQAGDRVRRSLLVLMGAVGFVLMIACANVANLLIGRTAARQREFAVRAALGAGRRRIARQLATENIVLSLLGAAVGLLLSMALVRFMLSLVPSALPRADDVVVDLAVVGVAALVAIVAGSLFAIAAAFHLRRTDVASALLSAGARASGGRSSRAGRRMLVVAEISMSLVLLIGAVQLGKSFLRLQRVDPGFDPSNAVVANVLYPMPRGVNLRDAPAWQALFAGLSERLQTAPGVAAAGAISGLPLTGRDEYSRVSVVGRPVAADDRGLAIIYSVVGGAYFDAMRVPMVQGRAFDETDRTDGPPAIIVNQEFVRRYLRGETPIGMQLLARFEFTRNAPPRVIVGVAGDVLQGGLNAEVTPQVYVPITQMGYPAMTVVLRAETGDSRALVSLLSREVRALEPNASVSEVRTLDAVIGESMARQRFSTTIIGIFAAISLVLAMVGIYSVIALAVRQRRREFGVRMALGAANANVIALVFREGVWVIAGGLALGLMGAFAVSEVLASMLFEVNTLDGWVFAASAAGVAIISLAAIYVPARSAMRVHPTEALRSD